jgi:hypothetical protein
LGILLQKAAGKKPINQAFTSYGDVAKIALNALSGYAFFEISMTRRWIRSLITGEQK